MPNAPVILVNHLLEPPGKTTGITRFLFALLEELASRSSFRYVLATTWQPSDLPQGIRATVSILSRRFVVSAPLNVATQMTVVPWLMHKTGAKLEFNCNPIGCCWPFWPRVTTVHDLYYELMPQNFRRRHRLWWQLFFPMSLAATSAVVCVSGATRQHLNRLHPRFAGKSVVIHEASALRGDTLAANDATPTLAQDKPYGLYVGNISLNKNPSVLARALKLLEERGRPMTVYHVGRDELGYLATAQREAGLRRAIRPTGVLNDRELAAVYRGASCLINTSLDEGFCLPVLEAQSFAIPVVCSDIPVLREVAGDGALFFDPIDPAALAGVLSDIMSKPDLRERMSRRAVDNSARFTWTRAAAEFEDLFRRVLGAGDAEQFKAAYTKAENKSKAARDHADPAP